MSTGPVGSLNVKINADDKPFRRGLDSAGKSVGGFKGKLSGLTSTLGGFGKALAIGGGIGLAVGGFSLLKGAVSAGIDEFKESQKVAAQTGAVIKSTGGAAGVTADHVSKLAGKIRDYSGVEDEAVQAGENMLMTFTNVKNGVGKGNDVFDQATKAAVDMSVAMGKDVPTSALMLGKALNDPISGLTALRKVGVQFTDQQEQMIKGMVDSGDTMGAQKVILAELNKEFGGSAAAAGKTFAGMWSIAKGKLEDIAGSIASKLMPYIQKGLQWVIDHMPQIEAVISAIVKGIGKTISFIVKILKPVVKFFQGLFSGIRKDSGKMNGTLGTIITIFNKIKEAAKSFVELVQAIWKRFGSNIIAQIKHTWAFISGLFKGAFDVIKGIFDVFAGILKGDWSKVWNGLKAIFKGVFSIITNLFKFFWNSIKNILAVAWKLIAAIAKTIWNAIAGFFKTILTAIGAVFVYIWNMIKSVVVGIWRAIVAVGKAIWNGFKAYYQALWAIVTTIFRTVWNTIKAVLETIWNIIKTVAETIWNAIKGAFDAVLSAIRVAFETVWNTIKTVLETIWNVIVAVFHAVWDAFVRVASAIWDGLKATWDAVWGAIKGALEEAWKGITWVYDKILKPIGEAAGKIWDGIKAAWKAAWEAAISVIKPIVNAAIKGVNAAIKAANWVNPFDDIPYIPEWKHTGDTELAQSGTYRLIKGEGILRAAAVRKLGPANMAMLSRGILPAGGRGGRTIEQLNVYFQSVSADYDHKRFEELLDRTFEDGAHLGRVRIKN